MVWRLIFHKGRLFFSPASACSSGAEAEGAILLQLLIKCSRLLFLRVVAAWPPSRSKSGRSERGKKKTTMICQGTDWFFESLFKESAVLSPLFLRSSSATTFKGVFRWAGNEERAGKNSHFCAWCVPGGEGAMPPMGSGSVILWFCDSPKHFEPVHQSHPSLVPVFSYLGKTHFPGRLNEPFQ